MVYTDGYDVDVFDIVYNKLIRKHKDYNSTENIDLKGIVILLYRQK